MSKMNGITRKKIYLELSQKHGELCQFCGRTSDMMQLVIDHIDNNNSNNSTENIRLLCRRCNYIKNPRRPVDECVSENVNEMSEIQINRTKEPQFKKMIAQLINEFQIYPAKDLINSVAEILELSPITVKRYLEKVCSSHGIYELSKMNQTLIVQYKKEIPDI